MSQSSLVAEERLLRAIAEGVEASTGEAFFRSLVKHLATALGVSNCFVSELTQGGTHYRTLAVWARGTLVPNFEVPVAGTPCEGVLKGDSVFHADHVQERFPSDSALAEEKAISYGGAPMFDSSGSVVGHVAFFHDGVFENEGPALAVMRIFAKRVVAEIERQQLEANLRASEERLSRVIASATDAIISYGEDGRIELFNAGAERVFQCTREEAMGSQIEKFLAAPSRATLRAASEQLDSTPESLVFMGADQSLQAQRADGRFFKIESSLSKTDIRSRPLYTLILRDIDERQKSEQELKRLRRQAEYLREEIAAVGTFETMAGTSPALRRALEQAQLVAKTDSTVLIRGETGTGKELLAHEIHSRSRRADRSLIKLNCAALPVNLVESELFGHEKGAFTGATKLRVGRFELAHRGTLFLDEVGELPLDAQAKLLRALQEQEFERIGGTQTHHVDVRLIAATNRNLERAMSEGKFREELYYRLNVFPITLPPLRARTEDILLLADVFIRRHAARVGRRITGICDEGRQRLLDYLWPGNIRELENVIERAMILTQGPLLEIPPQLLTVRVPLDDGSPPRTTNETPRTSLKDVERQHIENTLEATHWRIEGRGGAAARLGLPPSTLRSRMRKLGIARTPIE